MPRSEKRKNIKVSKTRRCKGEGTEMGWKDNWQGFALGQWWSRWIPHTLGGSARNASGKRAAAQGSVGTWKDERGELVRWLRSHWGWQGEKCACVYEGRFNPSWGSLIWLVNGFPRAAVRKYTNLCLKTWKMYPLTVLETRSPEWRCWKGRFLRDSSPPWRWQVAIKWEEVRHLNPEPS